LNVKDLEDMPRRFDCQGYPYLIPVCKFPYQNFTLHLIKDTCSTHCFEIRASNFEPRRRYGVGRNTTIFEICGLLDNYTASCGNYLPTFRDNVSVLSSRIKIPSRKESLLTKKLDSIAGWGNVRCDDSQ
jgi:hypothetical protein